MSRPTTLALLFAVVLAPLAFSAPSGCSSTDSPGAGGAGTSTAAGLADAAGGGATTGMQCPVTFTFTPGAPVDRVRVAGEWNSFNLDTAATMTVSGAGVYSATVALTPGLVAYKIVVDSGGMTNWELDPAQGRRKYVGGIENSAIKVHDCTLPSFVVTNSAATRAAAGNGSYAAALSFHDGVALSGADPAGTTAMLEQDGTSRALTATELTTDAMGNANIALGALADGKYRVVLGAKSKNGKVGEPLELVFWIEADAFVWKDSLLYMAVTDRFRDGDPTNNPPPTAGVDPREDWQGGDFEGIRQRIADGTLDKLGVRAIWLTPPMTAATGSNIAADNVHQVTGYHGYWPIKSREVEPRIGGATEFAALVKEAHAHGIRVMLDWVIHHVHQQHEYFAAHPSWFNVGCICGSNDCDWTVHALDCSFSSYLPNVDHTNPDADAAFVSDAVWWLDNFDLDGLRIDAVKQVPQIATRNLAAEVRETFEPAGTKYFLLGETAMGWSNCADPCNDQNYGTISEYIGPLGLDGQFDFVLYYAVSTTALAYSDEGMIHADYWFNHGVSEYPAAAIMTPYLGSHDTARFTTLADYRGQDAAHDRGIPGNEFDNVAVAPSDPEPYRRTRIAMSWLIGLPGMPLVYYGDEYGQWGGSDPNNRQMWRGDGPLSTDEAATLAWVQKLGTARKNVTPMRRGTYQSLQSTEDTLVFGRLIAMGNAAVVGITRATTDQPVTQNVAMGLGLMAGTTLHDALGGLDVVVAGDGTVSFTVPASGAVILSP